MLFLLLSKLGLVGGLKAHKILVTLGLDFGLGLGVWLLNYHLGHLDHATVNYYIMR